MTEYHDASFDRLDDSAPADSCGLRPASLAAPETRVDAVARIRSRYSLAVGGLPCPRSFVSAQRSAKGREDDASGLPSPTTPGRRRMPGARDEANPHDPRYGGIRDPLGTPSRLPPPRRSSRNHFAAVPRAAIACGLAVVRRAPAARRPRPEGRPRRV